MRRLFILAAILPAITVPLAAQDASVWLIDPAHSGAQFSVRHLTVSNVRGEFSKISGTVVLDTKDIRRSSVEVTVDATTIDTREPQRDAHLRSADFFDVAKHPTMTFKSKGVTPAGEGRLNVTGELTIRGVTREVLLRVEGPTPEIKDPWGNIKRGATATTKINRKDFGLMWNAVMETGGLVVGDEVSITIDVELAKKN